MVNIQISQKRCGLADLSLVFDLFCPDGFYS